MAAETKVLNGLMERRTLETEFGHLVATTEPAEQEAQAAAIAARGPLALTVLLSLLDTDDPLVRGRLGLVAQHLPREQVVAALRTVVAGTGSRSGTSPRPPGGLRPGADVDRARISAVIILDRFLKEPVDDLAVASMGDPDGVAHQSLQELIRAMEQEPVALLEYLAQLAQQPPDVSHLILKAVPGMGNGWQMVALLRMFAQDADPVLARGALEQLSHLRTAAAARALTSLAATLPPPLAILAERGRRKVHMSVGAGHQEAETESEPWYAPGRDWRVLISPVEGTGTQLIWFIGQPAGDEPVISCTIIVHAADGVRLASLQRAIDWLELPARTDPGTLQRIRPKGGGYPLLLLEGSLQVGRHLVREALALNWAQGTSPPIEFRLYNPLIWLAEPLDDIAADPSMPETEASGETADSVEAGSPSAIAGLLDHPAFVSWFWPSSAALPDSPIQDSTARAELITYIAHTQFGPETKTGYAKSLLKMARWFRLAGDVDTAAVARAAADEVTALPAEESIFLRRLIGLGLDLALAQRSLAERRPVRRMRKHVQPGHVPDWAPETDKP